MVETSFTTLRIVGHSRRRLDDPGDGLVELAIATRHPIVADAELPIAVSISDAVPQRHARSIRLDVGGREVDVTAFHVSSKLWYAAPWVQLRSLGRLVSDAEVDGRARPALLVGDANPLAHVHPVRAARLALDRARRGPSRPGGPHSQIDHILVRGEVDAVAGEVLPYTCTSDHRAISADLQLR